MGNFKIIFNPSEENIKDIQTWSTEKTYLYRSYRNNSLVVAEYNNYTVGFYCLSEQGGIVVKIETAETHNDFRRKGIGRFIFNEVQKKYKNHYAFILNFSSIESKTYCEKIGFVHSPTDVDIQKEMFKMIKSTNKINYENSCNTIEIIDDFGKNFKWNFELIADQLINPIFFFGFCKWKMVVKLKDTIIFNDEYRYFDDYNDITSCIFIKSIPCKYLK